MEKLLKLRCPKCGSASIQTRERTKDRRCQRCGYKGPMKEFEPEHQEAKK